MSHPVTGIHHVTAIASDPQRNIDFYAGLLGLRLVKRTVNFDDPSAYHLYYGDESGSPGSIVTFFYWPGMGAEGQVGAGQMTAITFSAAPGALDYWVDRLSRHGVSVERQTRFEEETLAFSDPDGIPLEIVAVAEDSRQGWAGAGIPVEHALRGLHSTQLTVRSGIATEKLLVEDMGCRCLRRERNRSRYEFGIGGSGRYADIVVDASGPFGMGGVGTIHHIAWRVGTDEEELGMKDRLHRSGFAVSPVMDRDYFHSIYYRERGGILFEIATESPGFAVDEPAESLGTELRLPKQYVPLREKIQIALPPLEPPRQYA